MFASLLLRSSSCCGSHKDRKGDQLCRHVTMRHTMLGPNCENKEQELPVMCMCGVCAGCAPPWAICGIVNSRWFTIRIIERFWIAAHAHDACKCISSFLRSVCNYSLPLLAYNFSCANGEAVMSYPIGHSLAFHQPSALCLTESDAKTGKKNASNFLNNMDGWAAAIADACALATYINIQWIQWFAIKNAMFISCDSFDGCDSRPFSKPLQLMSSSPPSKSHRSLFKR